MGNIIQSIPEAKLLLASLRSVGYTEETAIADIVSSRLGAQGTVVCIENLDRVIGSLDEAKAKKKFYKTAEKVEKHLALIFHRFIEEDGLVIRINGTEIQPWNGRKQNGSLLYTLLPIQLSIQQFYEQKLAKLDAECEQERIRKRLEAFQQAQQEATCPPA